MTSSATATQFLSLTKAAPYRKPRFHLQPRNRYLHLSSSTNYLSNKALFSLTSSNSFPLTKEVETNDSSATLREICQNHVPDHVLRRMEELGYEVPTDVQKEALPVLFSGNDCILHAQTGSGKTLTYLLLIYSVINPKRSAVQALIVVPTRELGMQVIMEVLVLVV